MTLSSPQDKLNSAGYQGPHILGFKKKYLILGLIFAVILLISSIILFINFSISSKQQEEFSSQLLDSKIDYFKGSYIADELIVRFQENQLERNENLKKKLKELGVVKQKKAYSSSDELLANYYLLKFKPGTDIKKAKEALDSFREVTVSHPNYLFTIEEVPNDTLYSSLWNLEKINMPKTWDETKGAGNIKVAVIDTGVNYNHEDFAGRNIIKGPDFSTCAKYSNTNPPFCVETKPQLDDPIDTFGHGTHVAGIIGAVTNNGLGIAGINWDISIMAIKALSGRVGSLDDIISGIKYAIDNNANVINMSFVSPDQTCQTLPELQTLIDQAISKNIIIVAAAGNEGKDVAEFMPASCNGVIAVGATDKNDKRGIWPTSREESNWGARVDISAPGEEILSLGLTDYIVKTGTSMAAPHIAAVAALILSKDPNLSQGQIKECLINGADSILTDKPIGGKRLNALNAVKICSGLIRTPSPIPTGVSSSAPVPLEAQKSFQTSKITGNVFIDTNDNKIKDNQELGYQSAQINLEGQQEKTTTTDSKGDFQFTDLAEGKFIVSLWINGQKVMSSRNIDLNSKIQASVSFPVSSALLTPITNSSAPQAPIIINPKIFPAPTPIVTYTCRESSLLQSVPQGTIQIGNLECFPND